MRSTRAAFDAELEQVSAVLQEMSALVQEAIGRAADSVLQRDADLARSVTAAEDLINDLQRGLRDDIFKVICTQQPVAGDLRRLMSAQFIGVELERMGDYAVRIAKRGRKLARTDGAVLQSVADEFREMVVLVESQVRGVLDAFGSRDDRAAREIAGNDRLVDGLNGRLTTALVDLVTRSPQHAADAQRLIEIVHTLERLGDRTTNVAEDVVFLVTGRVVELD